VGEGLPSLIRMLFTLAQTPDDQAIQRRFNNWGNGTPCDPRLPVRAADGEAWLPHAKRCVTGNPT